MYLKPDTTLLVNDKPLFLPDFAERYTANIAVAVLIDRMGRHIEERFAERYYHEMTVALNVRADLKSTKLNDLTRSIVFDNSFPIGKMIDKELFKASCVDDKFTIEQLVVPIDKAIARASSYVTLRTGDIVAIDFMALPFLLEREQIFTAMVAEQQVLKTKFK